MCLITNKIGEILYYDLDSYLLIGKIAEGNYGKRYVRGHFYPIRDAIISENGKFFVTVGLDGAKTWV